MFPLIMPARLFFDELFPHPLFHIRRLFPLILVALLLCSCRSLSTRGKRYFDQAGFKQRPPVSIAILPTTDASNHPELTKPMRKALFSAIAPLSYRDRELSDIDEFLNIEAA